MRTLCDAYYEENECHLRAFLDISLSIIITAREVIRARYDVILDQSERAHLYNHLRNTKT